MPLENPAQHLSAIIVDLPPRREKPSRPAGFPLFAHACGQWAKKVRGRLCYFGPWGDAQRALRKWHAQREDLLAGRRPRPLAPDELRLYQLCNAYLSAKKGLVERGEICERSFGDYLAACRRLCKVLGRDTAVAILAPEDFTRLRADMSKTWGPVRLLNELRRCRMVFTWGLQQEILPRLPSFGDALKRPSAKLLRKHRAERGKRMFESEQIRLLFEQARPTLRAMLLLGVNCGFGNHDVATVRRRHLDLKGGWANYPRPKTGVVRRALLWPETVRAVRRVLRLRDRRLKAAGESPADGAVTRPISKRNRSLVFLTKSLRRWRSGSRISGEFDSLIRRCGVKRPGLNFYALRHTFQTVANGAKDSQAVAAVMGHVARSDDMSAVYTEEIGDERLRAVAEHVRTWLFGQAAVSKGQAAG